MIVPVILAGGVGSRLWPLSRELYPKQFLDLTHSGESLFQHTLRRAQSLPNCLSPIIVCSVEHRFLVSEQIRALGIEDYSVLLEPVGRNTAPAVAIAALMARHLGVSQNHSLLIMPADHIIGGREEFEAVVAFADQLAQAGNLVTFGVVPDCPHTGYGYIKCGTEVVASAGAKESQDKDSQDIGHQVEQFVEKPDRKTAESFVASGDYLWNSGMFVMQADRYLEELKQHADDIYNASTAAFETCVHDLDFIRVSQERFEKIRSESIDYAVMEKTKRAVVCSLSAKWTDIGSWAALADTCDSDSDNNALHGDVVVANSKNTLVHADSRMVAAVGLDNIVIVETSDAVLVADKDASQDVKKVVNTLKAQQRKEVIAHDRVYRPWGWYETACLSERFQVKRIMVKPGASLSLQMHHHRAEHWVVVKGTAKVQRGEEDIILTEDQSTYIPLGTLHRLHNPGVIPLELIEVQTGSYLGEDDIVRFDDHYGRTPVEVEQ